MPIKFYDAFISASPHDMGWVDTVLLPSLEATGLKVCIPSRDFEIGVPELVNIEHAIQNSRKILLVLTPQWIEDEWSNFGALLGQTDDPAALRRRILPLILEDCNPPSRLRALTNADLRDRSSWPLQLMRIAKAVSDSEPAGNLPEHLTETIKLYLATTFERDQYARLDQAGESDDRTTLLRKVFVDLLVKLRSGPQPRDRTWLGFDVDSQSRAAIALISERPTSAMRWLLRQGRYKTVLVGGPGQGKSTLGQYLVQVHRASLLGRQSEMAWHAPGLTSSRRQEYLPTLPRIPFRIILKYYAQWLNDNSGNGTVERYLVEQLQADTNREVAPDEFHLMLSLRPILLILDGLDEVTENDLRSRLLSQIHEFLQRAEQLHSNIQIIATSRPTGYSDQFSPEHFWHLELQPMSAEKVRDYAVRWMLAKVAFEEERRRIIETLNECQTDEHTRLLLTTPLQVSIVLVIIKDGGRPPAQREALFHEYWSTIFRRERAKGKGVIRSEETILFGLHSFLAYLLHRKAFKENVQSLLTRDEFEKHIISFLRKNDRMAKASTIRQRAIDIVRESTRRLVLLVEPEPGLFGFELRSIQEFFAAVYLSQSARDTIVRFRRLRAISLSEHWRNVALFFSGRIVRNFSGEAANILELVCRPIDRELPDRFLKRGAWLALDIAAEGAFTNRDLQYGAVEHALSVLDGVLSRSKKYRLQTALSRLPSEDKREILRPLMRRRLQDCNDACELLADYIDLLLLTPGTKKLVLDKLGVLMQGSASQRSQALSIAIRAKVEPEWLGRIIDQSWEFFLESGSGNWFLDPSLIEYLQNVLNFTSLTAPRAFELTTAIAKNSHRRPFREPPRLASTTLSLPQQVATFCAALINISYLGRGSNHADSVPLRGLVLHASFEEKSDRGELIIFSKSELGNLLRRKDLLPTLRLALWSLYWYLERPRGSSVDRFISDLEAAQRAGIDKGTIRAFRFGLRWPLLEAAAMACQEGEDAQLASIAQALREDKSQAISLAIQEELTNLARWLSAHEWTNLIIEIRGGALRPIGNLDALSGGLSISTKSLINMHVIQFTSIDLDESHSLKLIDRIELRLTKGESTMPLVMMLGDNRSKKTAPVIKHLKALLARISASGGETIEDLSPVVAMLVILENSTPGSLTPTLVKRVAKLLGKKVEYPLSSPISIESASLFQALGSAMRSRDLTVKKGIVMLATGLLFDMDPQILRSSPITAFQWPDLERCLRIPSIPKWFVIRLFRLCDIPIESPEVRDQLLEIMRSAKAQEAASCNAFLLSSTHDQHQDAWRSLLERILEERHYYSAAILNGAIERYGALIGKMTSSNLLHDPGLELPE